MGKKTLAEELSELAKPQTDFDIEDIEGVPEDSEGSAESDQELRTDHYVKVGKSKLRRNEPKNVYGGTKTSRNEIFGGSDEGSEEESDEGSEESEEENAEESGEESDSGVSLDNYESEAESESEAEAEDEQKEESDDEHKRDKLKSLISQEKQTTGKRVAQSNINDALKGFSITNQNALFDKLIESRIKLQKSLTKANSLPVDAETAKEFITDSTEEKIEAVEDKCYALLENVIKLRNKLYKKDSIEPVPVPKKRKLNAHFEATNKLDARLSSFRSLTLNKWSAKVSNSSGSSALNASKFKVVNQSAEQQVVNTLNDMERLKKRTYLNRSAVQPLGYTEEEAEEVQEEENPDIPKVVVRKDRNEIKHIFDDEDFYRLLLNDLVDKKIASSNPVNGVTLSLRQSQKAQKANKNVDTKASKGRKLKYNIQDPIAHFETPVQPKWEDFQIDEFFASLLGQKINMNEIEEEETNEDNEIIADDSIKLFS